jgi:uncharacterized protein YecT (DUF1311 family)
MWVQLEDPTSACTRRARTHARDARRWAVMKAIAWIGLITLCGSAHSMKLELPCEELGTEKAVKECWRNERNKSESELQELLSLATERLEPQQATILMDSHKAWIESRSLLCKLHASAPARWPHTWDGCIAWQTNLRISSLRLVAGCVEMRLSACWKKAHSPAPNNSLEPTR